MRVELHIERLVLDGVEPHQVPAFREAITAALHRQLSDVTEFHPAAVRQVITRAVSAAGGPDAGR